MSASRPRLVHLLDLADKGPALRAALAEEVAEMLTNWPADCPREMRATCEALLAQAAREVDSDTRARLRVRLYADPELAARVLPREMPERALVEAARGGDVAASTWRAPWVLPPETASEHILADESGWAPGRRRQEHRPQPRRLFRAGAAGLSAQTRYQLRHLGAGRLRTDQRMWKRRSKLRGLGAADAGTHQAA